MRVRRSSLFLAALSVGALAAGSIVSTVGASADPSSADPASAALVTYHAAATFTPPPNQGSILEPESAYPLALTHGYTEHEFFASGRATAFKATATPNNGRWSIKRTTGASYRTRVLVRQPPKSRFNGTVVVEWMNVSGGESAPDWDFLNPMIEREGYAYVAVSDQALGVNGGTSILGDTSPGLVGSDPARYSTLHHPGDKYSLDIFAQIGVALHNPSTAARILGGLRPRRIVATGESQSAFYLTTFANALQPRTHAYDGFFIHSRGGGAAGFNGPISVTGANNVRIRTNLHVPVFMFETQTDLILLGYASAQQQDTTMIRTWEIAGTAHADSYVVGPYAGLLGCNTPLNDGPQHLVVQAAFTAFTTWVINKTSPQRPAPFQFHSKRPAVLALAADGDVRGGVRTPAVDVPIATLSGAAPAGANQTCSLFGSTTPFTKAELVTRYGTPEHYRSEYAASLANAIKHGYILAADGPSLLAAARKVTF